MQICNDLSQVIGCTNVGTLPSLSNLHFQSTLPVVDSPLLYNSYVHQLLGEAECRPQLVPTGSKVPHRDSPNRSVQAAIRLIQIGIFLVPASRPAVTAPVSDFSHRIHRTSRQPRKNDQPWI